MAPDFQKVQFDYQKRVVSLENLRAMCDRISGTMCHQFSIVSMSEHRVKVEYSNEDEYAATNPMTASFPVYRGGWGEVHVVMDIVGRITGDNWNGEGWQAFQPLLECPVLWRDPTNGKWASEDEINAAKASADLNLKGQS